MIIHASLPISVSGKRLTRVDLDLDLHLAERAISLCELAHGRWPFEATLEQLLAAEVDVC